MLAWLSPPFARTAHVDLQCLQAREADALSHENIFHSLLGVLDVGTNAYMPERDLFAPCRTDVDVSLVAARATTAGSS
jgi:lipid A ethanolaminephosphotransferase